MAAGEQASAEAATRHVRVSHAARRLYQLGPRSPPATSQPGLASLAARRIRRAEHRAHRALTRAGFADPAIAAAVLRQVQVLTMTTTLARLDYRTADAAQAAIANLIASPAAPSRRPQASMPAPCQQVNGHPASSARRAASDGDHDAQLVAAATRIVAGARRDGGRLSQVALGRELRSQGYTVANNRLRWLSSASGLAPRHGAEPDGQPPGSGNGSARPGQPEDRHSRAADREQRLAALRIRLQDSGPADPNRRGLGPVPADSRPAT